MRSTWVALEEGWRRNYGTSHLNGPRTLDYTVAAEKPREH